MLLASCGGAELWASTQAKYFEREARKRPFLHLLSAIIKTDLSELVQNSDLAHWQETLAVLSTYAKTEEFGPLCAQLGKRLAEELNDKASATLCYMCAVDIRQTALYWIEEFKEACARAGMLDTMALQDFIEKVIVFREADPNTDLGAECAEMFVQYAELLASQVNHLLLICLVPSLLVVVTHLCLSFHCLTGQAGHCCQVCHRQRSQHCDSARQTLPRWRCEVWHAAACVPVRAQGRRRPGRHFAQTCCVWRHPSCWCHAS